MTQAAALAPNPAEAPLSPRDFQRLAALIHDICGIHIQPSRQIMLEGRLRRRLRATGITSFAAYCAWLFAPENLRAETEHLINAITTNKTDFFREPNHFTYLRDHILPQFAQHRRPIRCWSAACSSGAEPYTLAMVLDAYAAEHGGPDYGILATDIDTDMLARARHGIYPAEMLSPVPVPLRLRYVRAASDAARAECRIVPELRGAIGFAPLNLMDDAYPVGEAMDIIFCRNVLIYFDKKTQDQVIARLVDCLHPGGYLFLGHSETVNDASLGLTSVGGTIYAKARP